MNKKILIVEDNIDVIYILRRQVANMGYETLLATNGKEAVEMASLHLPDLILMDIMLPEMDGLEATRLIRRNPKTQSIPIIAATARITMKDREECLQNGCDGYIAKPFTPAQLSANIEKLIGKN